jgi:ABC-type amino acid transport substrate-binding protein
LHRFDAYRLEHPDTKLRPSGFYYRIGFNMGFAALSTERALVEQVDRAIDEMAAKGEFAVLARAAGMTYLPPHSPDILEGIPMGDLSGD